MWNNTKKFIAFLACLFCLYKSISVFMNAQTTDNFPAAFVSAIFIVGECVFWGFVNFIIFYIFLFDDIVQYGVYSLLWKRTFIKKSPPAISQIKGLIAQYKFEEAEDLLLEEIKNYPNSSELYLEYFDMNYLHKKDINSALQLANEYFSLENREPSKENYNLLNAYIDLLMECNILNDFKDFLNLEIKKNKRLYTLKEYKKIIYKVNKIES